MSHSIQRNNCIKIRWKTKQICIHSKILEFEHLIVPFPKQKNELKLDEKQEDNYTHQQWKKRLIG